VCVYVYVCVFEGTCVEIVSGSLLMYVGLF